VRVLVTRPEPDCERTAALLRSSGHEVLLLRLLRIETVKDAKFGAGPWAATLFTSANAIRAIAAHHRFGEIAALPAYVVGQRTLAAAVAAGFAPVISADGDVNDLVRLIASKPPVGNLPLKAPRLRRNRATSSSPWDEGLAADQPQFTPPVKLPLLYCAGEDRAGDLAGALQQLGFRVETVIAYRSAMETNLTPEVRSALEAGAIDAVLHYSARTAAAFVAAVTNAGIRDLSIQVRHLCLSARVAAPLMEAGAQAVEIADEPNEQALFVNIGRA